MRKGLTEVVFILDRSGSMSGLEADTIGGFNSMIAKQKKEEGEAYISTVLFDDTCEVLYAREEDRPEKTLFIITTDGIDSNRALNYVSDHKGTQLNYEVLNKTVSEFRACKSLVKEEIDAMFAACSAPIKDDYKRHRN